MAKKVALSTLNASTIDILNTIRANGSLEYQSQVPVVKTEGDIPRVGEILYGYPALANQFINALVNRIALVRVKSATFNNAYANLKKGYLEFGETVEEIFVGIAKARAFSAEKAASREYKRTLPDVKTAFHAMNWKVQYPVTIQDEDLRQAFLSVGGVQDLIAKIIDSVYTAMEYDEFLLFKYLMIKAIAHGKMKAVSIGNTPNEAAVAFRGTSNMLTFLKDDFNEVGVLTSTPKDDQYIFMDAMFNAQYDVNVLAGAFNMDKATFIGKLHIIDDWTSFDNERFEEIRKESEMIEEVTAEELALLAGVKAVLVDEEWFQIYDNTIKFTETYASSGLYWNYFLNVWKTISSSPFSNAVVFVDGEVTVPNSLEFVVTDKSVGANATTLSLVGNYNGLVGGAYRFVQTEECTTAGVAVHPYGGVMFPADCSDAVTLELEVGDVAYTAGGAVSTETEVGTVLTFTKQ